jgi:hypothetical protein
MPAAAASRDTASWLGQLWVASAVLFTLSVLIRLVDIGQLARFDELYTILAARGWLAHGVPQIANGVYDRVELYTVFIGWCLKLFGANLIVARLPSVLFGSLLAVAVFLWVDAVAGRTAAWISGLFVALSSMSVELSQYARFYSLQALTFWLGAIGLYALATGQVVRQTRRIAVAIGTALSLVCAVYLQALSLIGVAGLAAWFALAVLLPALARRPREQFWGMLAALAIVVVSLAAAVLWSGAARPLLKLYLHTPLTVVQHKGELWFYHLHLIDRYPTLWPVFPVLAIVAVAAKPRPSIFALVVFGVAFALLSFAGPKSLMYMFFAEPFLYVLCAIALAQLWRPLWVVVRTAGERMLDGVRPALRHMLGWGLVGACLAFLLLANGSTARTILRPLGIRLGEGFSAGWPSAAPELERPVRDADVVLTSHELHMLYYLGRADIVVSKERLAEFADTEFARDRRTGLPVVSRPESIELIMTCYPTGVLVTDTLKGWRAPTVIDDPASDLIQRRMLPIELPTRSNIKAFRWERPAEVADAAACAAIRQNR